MPTGESGTVTSVGTARSRFLNAALDFADVVQILGEAGAVGRGQLLVQRGNFVFHRIEDAAGLVPARIALGIVASVAEEPFENHLRIILHGQRRGCRLPGERVHVSAGQPRAAAQRNVFNGELERGQRRILPDLFRRHLVHGLADVGFDALFRMRAAEEDRGRALVIRAGIAIDPARRVAPPGRSPRSGSCGTAPAA